MFRSRALVFAGAAALFACPAVPQKMPDTRVDVTGTAWGPKVGGNGYDVYVVWDDFRSGGSDVYFCASDDGGNTWSAELRLSHGVSRSSGPQMSTAGDNIYVVYNDSGRTSTSGLSDIYFNRSTDGGWSWLRPELKVDTAPPYTTSRDPQISSSGDNVYVVWEDFRTGWTDIYINRSTTAGQSFLPNDIRVNQTGASYSTLPAVSCAGSNVYVVWEDDRNGLNKDIYFNSSTDGGLTWLATDRRLDTDVAGAANSERPQIACNGNGVYVVWEDRRNGAADIYFNRSTDGGATWLAADVRLDVDPTGGGMSNFARIDVSGANVYVVWHDFGGRDIYFQRSTNSGVTWLADDVQIDRTNASSWQPRIDSDGDHVYVTWQDLRNGAKTPDIYYNRSTDNGTTWLSADVRVNTEPISTIKSETPEISSGAGNAYVVWADYRGGTRNVYFNIPHGFQHYGAGLPGSGNRIPQLDSGGHATLGSSFSLNVWNGLGAAQAVLLAGTAKASLPLFGGTVLVTPAVSPSVWLGGAAGVPGAGTATLPLSVPNDPTLLGVDLYFQVLVLDPGAVFGVAMSTGLEMWIG